MLSAGALNIILLKMWSNVVVNIFSLATIWYSIKQRLTNESPEDKDDADDDEGFDGGESLRLRDVVGDADIFYPQINISTSAKVTKKEFTIFYKIFISKLYIFCTGSSCFWLF